MSDEKAVANAADEEQVSKAGKKDVDKRRLELADLSWVLSDRRGRRVMWRIMGVLGTFAKVWDRDPVIMGLKAAQQEVGHWLREEVVQAREEAFLEMQQEHLKEKR